MSGWCWSALLVRKSPAVGSAVWIAVGHATESERGDVQAGIAEFDVLHGLQPILDLARPVCGTAAADGVRLFPGGVMATRRS